MSQHESTYKPGSRLEHWMDERLPLMRMMHGQFVDFPTPRNLNYLWTFGGILTFCLVVQIVTGIVLAMHYIPNADMAFDSVEKIRRDVNFGWLIRNVHAVGSSMFFFAVYIHMARGLYYGSYKAPREVLWILGVLLFLLMMATGFLGYTLPWGQMSFWGVTVITNLFSSLDSIIPGLGTKIVQWLWGGFSVSTVTLNRFFSLHYLLPFVIVGVVALHIWALHVVGQNNPTGLDIKTANDSVPMAPHAVAKGHVRARRFCDSVRLVRLLRAGLSRARRQLRAGESAGNAAAHRAGMVLPPILRDPARDPLEARRRHRDVLGNHNTGLHPVARHEPRAVGAVSADLQVVHVVLLLLGAGAGLSRRQTGRGHLRRVGAVLHALLLRVLPPDHADCGCDGNTVGHAALDRRVRAWWQRTSDGGRRGSREALETGASQ